MRPIIHRERMTEGPYAGITLPELYQDDSEFKDLIFYKMLLDSNLVRSSSLDAIRKNVAYKIVRDGLDSLFLVSDPEAYIREPNI